MRIDVKKYLFFGLQSDKKPFFEKAQQLGIIDFIEDPQKKSFQNIPEEMNTLLYALNILKGVPPHEPRRNVEKSELQKAAKEIVEAKENLLKLDEESKHLKQEKVRVEIFGDFSKEEVETLEKETGYKFRYFARKHGSLEKLPEGMVPIGSDHGLDYFVFVSKEEGSLSGFIEMKIEKPIGVLKKESVLLEKKRHFFEERLKALAAYSKPLHRFFLDELEKFELENAKSAAKSTLDESLFVIEGYVPISREKELKPLAEQFHVDIAEIAIEEKDRVPTYLENEGLSRMGEDLVHIYDTPSITDKDPSLWVLWFFALFFAFIVGDAGYGLIFLATSLYIRNKYDVPKTGTKRRILNLFTLLAGSCIIWGAMTSSFFGISLPFDNPLRQASPMQYLIEKKAEYHFREKTSTYEYWLKKEPILEKAQSGKEAIALSEEMMNKFQDNIMMELALFIGIVHLVISLLRYSGRNYMAFGWVAVLIGGFFYFPYYLETETFMNYAFGIDRVRLANEGMRLFIAGFSFSFLLGLFKYKWVGVFEVMTLVQLLADVLSYLRLYALGLAGAIFSSTVNELAGAAGLVLGFFIIIFGHAVNILLGVMGGVIHGLRLNFLEWYHYSFEGGGKKFRPLKKIEHQ